MGLVRPENETSPPTIQSNCYYWNLFLENMYNLLTTDGVVCVASSFACTMRCLSHRKPSCRYTFSISVSVQPGLQYSYSQVRYTYGGIAYERGTYIYVDCNITQTNLQVLFCVVVKLAGDSLCFLLLLFGGKISRRNFIQYLPIAACVAFFVV